MNDQDEEEMAANSKTDSDKDIPDGPMRPEEKRRLHWEGKTYLVRHIHPRCCSEVSLLTRTLSSGPSYHDRYVPAAPFRRRCYTLN
jgi:hypothetical protein